MATKSSSKTSKTSKPVKTTKAAKSTKTVKAAKPAKRTKAAPKKVNPFDGMKPIRKPMTKTELIQRLADKCEVEPRHVRKIMAELENTIARSVMRKSNGSFMWAGYFKITTTAIPAKKGGEKKPNPFKPGEMYITKDKPATVRLKVRPLVKLRAASLASA